MASKATIAQEKARKARKDKSFWRQLWPFLRANVKGSGKKLLGAAFAGFILPVVVSYGMFVSHSRLTVEIGAYAAAYLAANIALTALATEETKRNHTHVIPVLTVFTQVNTVLVGVVLLLGKIVAVNLT